MNCVEKECLFEFVFSCQCQVKYIVPFFVVVAIFVPAVVVFFSAVFVTAVSVCNW